MAVLDEVALQVSGEVQPVEEGERILRTWVRPGDGGLRPSTSPGSRAHLAMQVDPAMALGRRWAGCVSATRSQDDPECAEIFLSAPS